MKEYRFSELSKLAQVKAVYDYLKGWNDTHPDNDLSFYEAFDILLDNNEVYSKNGEIIVDNW